jgi:hypothetical protein
MNFDWPKRSPHFPESRLWVNASIRYFPGIDLWFRTPQAIRLPKIMLAIQSDTLKIRLAQTMLLHRQRPDSRTNYFSEHELATSIDPDA